MESIRALTLVPLFASSTRDLGLLTFTIQAQLASLFFEPNIFLSVIAPNVHVKIAELPFNLYIWWIRCQ